MIEFDLGSLAEAISISGTRHQLSRVRPSDWAEARRMMTPDVSTISGKFKYYNSPYLREIVDFYSLDNPWQVGAFMKGSQIGNTRGVIENAIGWIIENQPSNILYLVGHSELVNPSMMNLDRMIDSTEIRHLIRSTTQRQRKTKSGDTDKMKEFPNGYLKLGHVNHKSLRNESFQSGFIDDYEAMKGATEQAGDTESLILHRFAGYAKKRKVLFMSSPELKNHSNIEPLFLKGDQRYWHVPCPNCNDFITWQWEVEEDKKKIGGIVYELKDGLLVPDSVGYQCQKCQHIFDDRNKMEMLNDGKFIPTAKPTREGYVSWHVSALYAPSFMYGWTHYVREYLEAYPIGGQEVEAKAKTFWNLGMGLTYEEKTEAPSGSQLQLNIRKYPIGIGPERMSIKDGNGRILLMTIAVDLNGVVDDCRLDWEVVAHTESGSTYSMDHGSIGTFIPREGTRKKKVDRERWTYKHNTQRSVWPVLDAIIATKFEVETEGGGMKYMRIFCGAMDVGHYDDHAWPYIDSRKDFSWFGLKGEGMTDNPVIRTKHLAVEHNLKYYKIGKTRANLFIINVNLVKDDLAGRMRLEYNPTYQDQQPANFMNYPEPSGGKYLFDNYFIHFEAEHRVNERRGDGTVIGTKWKKKMSTMQNHFFDIVVYTMAVRDIWVDQVMKEVGVKTPTWSDYCDFVMRRNRWKKK